MSAVAVDVLGTAVSIAAPAPLLADLRVALADLPPARSADRQLALIPTDRGFELTDDGRVVRRGVEPSIAAATVVWRLNAIAGESTAHVLVHAASVAGPAGGAVLLPGGSGAGKSTLTAACVAAGLSYLSDELAAVDRRTGSLVPYPRPLGLDGERLVPASSLGLVATGTPATPAALVFPHYEPDAGVTEVPLDSGWALLALAAHCTNLAALGGAALARLAGLAVACPASQLTYGDAGEAVAVVERAAAAPGRPVAPAEVLAPITEATTAVALGDALAVLHEPSGRIHLLNAEAAAVWRGAAGAADARDAVSMLDAQLGPTGDGSSDRSVAAATIHQLRQTGLLAGPAEA